MGNKSSRGAHHSNDNTPPPSYESVVCEQNEPKQDTSAQPVPHSMQYIENARDAFNRAQRAEYEARYKMGCIGIINIINEGIDICMNKNLKGFNTVLKVAPQSQYATTELDDSLMERVYNFACKTYGHLHFEKTEHVHGKHIYYNVKFPTNCQITYL